MSLPILKRLAGRHPRAAGLLVSTALFLAFGADPVAAGDVSPNGVFLGP